MTDDDRMFVEFKDFVSDEPLSIIRYNECEHHHNELTTKRFRRFWNEIASREKTINSLQSRIKVETKPTPESCKLTAENTGDGWLLAVENYDLTEPVAFLEWPESWPETMTADQLRASGFIIV